PCSCTTPTACRRRAPCRQAWAPCRCPPSAWPRPASMPALWPSTACGPRNSAEGSEQLGGRVLGADLVPGLFDLALLVDQEGRPDDAHVRAAVVLLLAPYAICLGHGVVFVCEQRE